MLVLSSFGSPPAAHRRAALEQMKAVVAAIVEGTKVLRSGTCRGAFPHVLAASRALAVARSERAAAGLSPGVALVNLRNQVIALDREFREQCVRSSPPVT